MNNNYKIGKTEAIFAISIVMVNRIILNLPYSILENTGTGSVINLIYVGIIGLIFVLLINKLFKAFPNSDIVDLAEFSGGNIFKIIIGIFFVCLLFLTLFSTVIDFTNLLKIIYFHRSPVIFIVIFFILALLISNLIGLRSIAKTISLILPFTIISILFSFGAVFDSISVDSFTPIFGNGYKSVFVNGLTNLFSFSIIIFFFFFKPLLKNSFDFSKVTIISFVISWILLLLTVLSLLIAFPAIHASSNLNFLYSLARKIELGDFLQRLDALFIILWILCVFSYLSIITYLITTILKKLTLSTERNMFAYLVSIILLGLSLLPINIAEIKFIQGTIYKYVILCSFAIGILVLIIANLKFKYTQKSRRKKMTKKIFIVFILTILLFTLTGCYDANTIEDSYYIVALGIDLNEDDSKIPYHISIQIAKNKNSSEASGSSSQSSAYSIYSVDAESLNSGISILNNYLDKKINLSHCSAIIFSEALARQGIGDMLKALSNDHEIRPNSYILISSNKAEDVLDKVSNSGEDFSSRFYEYIINSFDYTGYSVETTFNKILSEINDTLGDTIAIYTSINGDSIQNQGLAIFKDDRMVGHTSAIDSIAYLLLVNKLEESNITITNPIEENSKIDLEIGIMKDCHKDVEIINNTPYIDIDIYVSAHIASSGDSFDYTSSDNIHKVEETSEKYVKNLITDFLYKISKEYDADIFNFENLYSTKCLTNKELEDIHFDKIYKDSVFNVNVDISISSTHLFEKE